MTRTADVRDDDHRHNNGGDVDPMNLEVMVGSPSSTATPGGGRVGGTAASSFEVVHKNEGGGSGSRGSSKRELYSNTSEEDTDEEAQQQKLNSAKTKDENGGSDDDFKDEDEKNGIIEEDLPATIFSLMYVSEPNSRAHWYSFFLWAVQITITVAALLDSIDEGGNNPGKFPILWQRMTCNHNRAIN